MKRIFFIILWLVGMATSLTAQNASVRVCTEQDIPMSVRSRYHLYAKQLIENFYAQLPFCMENEMILEGVVSNYLVEGNQRYAPDFLKKQTSGSYLTPKQYIQELCKEYRDYADKDFNITVKNITFEKDFYATSMISCYVIAQYDLTLRAGQRMLSTHRSKAYCFFPNASQWISVQLMQIEPANTSASSASATVTTTRDKGNNSYQYNGNNTTLDARGQHELGMQYFNKKEFSRAVQCFQESLDKGGVWSYWQLGYCYEKGIGGLAPDNKKAFELYSKSAERGESDGFYFKGWAYENGIGVRKDVGMAYIWYEKANKNGYKEAQKAMDRVRNKTSHPVKNNTLKSENNYSTANSSTQINDKKTVEGVEGYVFEMVNSKLESVIAASVVIKGSTYGTITDFDGAYYLPNAKVGDILVISFVGYKTAEVVLTEDNIGTTLKTTLKKKKFSRY